MRRKQQHEPNQALGDKCALDYPLSPSCPTQGCATFANITLRDVRIIDPLLSPGVILGNATNPMQSLVFDNVVVERGQSALRGSLPFGRGYRCSHAAVTSSASTDPKPCA